MSEELKTYDFPVDHGDFTATVEQFYLKSEADEVIAELRGDLKDLWDDKHFTDKLLDERNIEIAELTKQVHDYAQGLYVMQASAEKEVRHHKYKRCLAMAKWCNAQDKYLDNLETWQLTNKEYKLVQDGYWVKWHKRWLELAEKFEG